MRPKKNQAFTLVELLVVISIIALLVAIVLPAINNALFRGKLTATATNGRSLQQSVFARVTEDVYVTSESPWPTSVANATPANPGFANSEEYIVSLMDNGTLNVGFNFFTAPGIPSAPNKQDFENGGFNAWCFTADLSDASTETLPLLFTKNLQINKLDEGTLYNNGGGKSEALKKVNPFQDKGFVFVTKGGSAYSLFKDQLKCGTEEDPGQFRMLFDVKEQNVDDDAGGAEPVPADNEILRPADEEEA